MTAANPFVPPGDDPYSDGPLDPDLHAGWFIDDVGGHGERLAEFAQQLHVPAIARRGRLAVVEGPERSGKTTLVNRCVQLVRERVPRGTVLSTLDLRGVSPTKPDGTMRSGHEMRWTVCRHALEEASWLTDEQRTRGADMLERPSVEECDPGLVYRFMRRNLVQDRIAVVLLPTGPPDIDAANLETYDGWMGPGMLFFAERTTTPGSLPLARRPPRPDSLPLLSLPLRHLEPGEAWTVVERRLGALAAGSGLPGVTEETLRKVEGLNRDDQHTIGWVVALFRRLYGRRIGGRSEFDGLPFIEFPEITDLLARREPEAP
ncbi:hypothetical protein [Pseudonocardia humida]|uniref:Uncharacterized protein n=1 Tax=Pseudonocardia humida TaxID=2800819 RepID=A0ABT1ABQ9_9PSEU|nr:hypothetical protein [Pseudonocardia humida]MCO1660428.1 hypothetical protein [Pseudonocardia humida]